MNAGGNRRFKKEEGRIMNETQKGFWLLGYFALQFHSIPIVNLSFCRVLRASDDLMDNSP